MFPRNNKPVKFRQDKTEDEIINDILIEALMRFIILPVISGILTYKLISSILP